MLAVSFGLFCLTPAMATIVSGRVSDHLTDTPLANMHLAIWLVHPFGTLVVSSATTDANGNYLWDGTCDTGIVTCGIGVDDPRYVRTAKYFSTTAATFVADFPLLRASSVSGAIRIDGAPADRLVGVNVSYYADGYWHYSVSATRQEENGRYVFERLAPDFIYRFCAGGPAVGVIEQCYRLRDRTSLAGEPPSDTITLAEGQVLENVDFELHSGGRIEGTLRDGYLSVSLANTTMRLVVYDASGNELASFPTTSDDNGRYRASGLPDGSYYVAARIDGPFKDATQLYPGIVCEEDQCPPATDGQRVQISGGSTVSAVDFTVHPQVVLKGRVTDEVGGQGIEGVEIWRNDRSELSTTTNASGEFAFYTYGGSNSSPFRVIAHGAQPHIDQVYPGASCTRYTCRDLGQPLHPEIDDVLEDIDFVLELGAAISGTVVDATTGLREYAPISLYDSEFKLLWSGYPDEEGRYLSDAWYPGIYYVMANGYSIDCVFYLARPCPFSDQGPGAVAPTPITIGSGEVRSDIDFRLLTEAVFRNGFGS